MRVDLSQQRILFAGKGAVAIFGYGDALNLAAVRADLLSGAACTLLALRINRVLINTRD